MAESQTENPSPKVKKAYFLPTLFKLMLLGICTLGIYAIYLDGKIRNKMEGQIWQLPAEVYSRIETISLEQNLTLEQVKSILLDNGYREVSLIATPGDFKVENNTLVLLRRAFQFPQEPEAAPGRD